MRFKNFLSVVFAGVMLTLLVLLVFAVLSWLNVPTGRFLDWVIGLLSFWWLVAIVTIPWNVYFQAQEVLTEAAKSQEIGIPVKTGEVTYVARLAKQTLPLALALHAFSALGLYLLAVTGISPIGYFASGLALLLTGVRPAIRAHDYIVRRLTLISQEIKYPRQDVVELRNRVAALEQRAKALEAQLDLNKPESWAAGQQRQFQTLQNDLTRAQVALENLRVQNQAEHVQIAHDAQQSMTHLTRDSEFLEHVRALIRFYKNA
jgi:hypothetical protein